MDFFKNSFSKKNDDVIVKEKVKPIKIDYKQEPLQAATIVINGIQKGEYSDIGQKLEELPSTGFRRMQYVFEYPKTDSYWWMIGICTVFLLVYLYIAVMGFGMHIYSDKYEIYSMSFLGTTVLVFIINISLIIWASSAIRFARRYKKYFELLKYKNIEIIDDICKYTSFSYSRVVNDLSIAVKQKLIPQGHFSTENLVFIASDEMFKKYQENRPVYDRYYKKIIEERTRIEERSEEIQKILDVGQSYINKIHDSNAIINDKEISLKLDHMEKIVKTIFREVDLNPRQSGKLGMLLNYYLPTADKLLSTYIDVDEKEIEGDSIRNVKKDIERAIDMLIVSFEGILNQFYEEQELDIASDVSSMEALIAQEQSL
ncbi:5-bromo-4-chloroindolyl phosphate hydrolysis family protein [Sporofaciens sp. SGI.106]|uniref:5-bromo-4-chloroindolyl phosphate hydrolysis family protein n=1 Tax=Sporofaciens sp. SGI.106 TaxID=3420568 RepID=UPI003D04BF0E